MKYNFFDKISKKNIEPSLYTQFGNTYPQDITTEDLVTLKYFNLIKKNVRDRLINILLNCYSWDLNEDLNERVIEYGLLTTGAFCIFKNKIGIFGLPCIPNNMYNIYGDPTQVEVFGFNGYTELVNIHYYKNYPTVVGFSDLIKQNEGAPVGVFMRDNYDNKKYIEYIDEFSFVLSDNIIALYNATNRLKDPYILAIKDKMMKKNFSKLLNNIKNNKIDIFLIKENLKDLGDGAVKNYIEKIDLSGHPESPKKIYEIYTANLNRFLEIAGINTNPSPDKSQVVLTPELNSNNNIINLENDVRFKTRQKFCNDVNNFFNLKISVKKNNVDVEKIKNDFIKGVENESGLSNNNKQS